MNKKDRQLYDVCCDVINIVEGYNYTKADIKSAYDNAVKITKKLDRKDQDHGK